MSLVNFGVKVKELRISPNEEFILILLHNDDFICYKNLNEKINFRILSDKENNNSNLLLIDYVDNTHDKNLVVFNVIDLNSYKFYQLIFSSSITTFDKPIVKIHELLLSEKIERFYNIMIVSNGQ